MFILNKNSFFGFFCLLFILLFLLLFDSGCGQNKTSFRESFIDNLYSDQELRSISKQYIDDINQTNKLKSFYKHNQLILKNMLIDDDQRGCFGKDKINKIQLKIIADKAANEYLGNFSDKHYYPTNTNSENIKIEFSPDISIFEIQADLNNKSQFVFDDFDTNILVGQIKYIKIYKTDKNIKSKPTYTRFGCGFLWLGKCKTYNFYLYNRWYISQITIHINDQLFYSNLVNFTVNGLEDIWIDSNLIQNRAYSQLMLRKDCDLRVFDDEKLQ